MYFKLKCHNKDLGFISSKRLPVNAFEWNAFGFFVVEKEISFRIANSAALTGRDEMENKTYCFPFSLKVWRMVGDIVWDRRDVCATWQHSGFCETIFSRSRLQESRESAATREPGSTRTEWCTEPGKDQTHKEHRIWLLMNTDKIKGLFSQVILSFLH